MESLGYDLKKKNGILYEESVDSRRLRPRKRKFTCRARAERKKGGGKREKATTNGAEREEARLAAWSRAQLSLTL